MDFIPEFFDLGSTQSCFASTNGSMICFGDNRYGEVCAVITLLLSILYFGNSLIFHFPSAWVRRY